MDGGFRHDSAWNCYGPYLTLQLAHAFLLLGDVARMDQCLRWLVGNARLPYGRQGELPHALAGRARRLERAALLPDLQGLP